MHGPRITIEGRQPDVFRLAAKLTRPNDGLRPWRQVRAYYYPGGVRVELAPIGLDGDGRQKHLVNPEDFCANCKYSAQCPGRGKTAHARACADVEISRLRRQVEAEANPVRFVYHPPVYGEEDIDYWAKP